MGKKKIFLIAGRTASGKSTIAREICKDLGLKQVKSYTTRPPRPEEETDPDHTDHIFISESEMSQYQDDIAAYTKIGDYHYFTTRKILDESDVYVIDPKGILDLEGRCGDRYDFVVIYLNLSHYGIAQERFLKRGGTRAEFQTRWAAEEKQFDEFAIKGAWDYSVHTAGRLPKVVIREVASIIRSEMAPVPERLLTIPRSELEKIFSEYIERVKDYRKEIPSTYNEGWLFGNLRETEKWLTLFDVDLSFETIEPMVKGTAPVQMKLKDENKRKGEN